MERLERASREELREVVVRQQAEIAVLLARVDELEGEVRRLRRGGGSQGELSIRPSRPLREHKPRKRREQAFVRRREAPDEVRYHALERCPDCGRKLCGGWEHRRRQSIELMVDKRVVDHVLLGRWCGVCSKRWLPEAEPSQLGVQGKRRFGASVQGLVAMLNVGCRLPIDMIQRLLRELFGLGISEGEVVKLLDGVRAAGRKELARLHNEVRGSPVVCADETGWRQDGENGYLWGFFTPKVRWFLYRQSRSGQVPREVLGEQFEGKTVCDFYAGYNPPEAGSSGAGCI